MKKQLFFTLVCVLLFPSIKAEMTHTQAQEVIKQTTRYIDPHKVLQQCDGWKKLDTEIKAEGLKRQQEVEDLVKKGQAIQTKLQSGMIKPEAQEQQQLELMKLQQEIEMKQRQGQQALQKKYEQGQMAIYKEIEIVAKEFAAKNNLTFIFAGGFIYADPTLDVSQDLAQAINKKHVAKKAPIKPTPVTPKK